MNEASEPSENRPRCFQYTKGAAYFDPSAPGWVAHNRYEEWAYYLGYRPANLEASNHWCYQETLAPFIERCLKASFTPLRERPELMAYEKDATTEGGSLAYVIFGDALKVYGDDEGNNMVLPLDLDGFFDDLTIVRLDGVYTPLWMRPFGGLKEGKLIAIALPCDPQIRTPVFARSEAEAFWGRDVAQ